MTNEKIWEIAYRQSAVDCNCKPEDFLSDTHVFTVSKKNDKARKYLPLPFEFDMVTYGNSIVADTSERLMPVARAYLDKYWAAHAFETPNIHVLDEMLEPYGLKVCFMAEYFLPDINLLKEQPCPYELKILKQEDFKELYRPEWSNALCEARKHLDVLGVGAYDGEKLVGLAGCSADCDDMYQIGVDVLPDYRRQGIAAAVTSKLAIEILNLEKVPFYCTAWCNLRSVRNAVKCGFVPAWCVLTVRDVEFVREFNSQLKLR